MISNDQLTELLRQAFVDANLSDPVCCHLGSMQTKAVWFAMRLAFAEGRQFEKEHAETV